MGTGSFPGVKSDRGVTLIPHPLLVSWSRKSRAISLLPLWAERPVQSFSACTRANFTFFTPLQMCAKHINNTYSKTDALDGHINLSKFERIHFMFHTNPKLAL